MQYLSGAKVKKIVYVDMDNVLVDFPSGLKKVSSKTRLEYKGKEDNIPNIFSLMDPKPGAIESFLELSKWFETFVLSTSPWENPTAWSDKLIWIKRYLGESARKKLILTHRKDLAIGDYLIDDRPDNGANKFKGEWIHFGQGKYPDWQAVMSYLRTRENMQV
jgi:5'-nucleotidase